VDRNENWRPARLSLQIGAVFGKLTITASLGRVKGRRVYLCRCSCGVILQRPESNLRRSLRCRSCGTVESAKKRLKHGQVESSEYRSWTSMLSRCYYAGNVAYDRYWVPGVARTHIPNLALRLESEGMAARELGQ
jgi:hypothetical protein